jgi:hypothetical protein
MTIPNPATVNGLGPDNDLVYAGYDPGYGANKVARVNEDGEMTTYVLPSAVGLASRGSKEGLSLGGVVRGQRQTGRQPFRVVFNGVEYLVGPNVAGYTKPITRMDFDRFNDSPELRATLYASLYQIVNGGARRLALAIALPVAVLENETEAERVNQEMRSWLIGQHLFSVDGVETALTITNIRAKIPQPVVTWFDWGLDSRGQWIKGREAQMAPTMIVDQGFNTLDVLVTESGRISDRLTGGDTLGMSRAADELIQVLSHRYQVALELPRAAELIKDAANGQKAAIYVNGERVEVTPEAKGCLSSLAADVDNYLGRMVGKLKQSYRVLLTGGGVLAMRKTLLNRFPQAVLMPDPVLANARGLAKLANRPGFLS